jgi:hypothetical protein
VHALADALQRHGTAGVSRQWLRTTCGSCGRGGAGPNGAVVAMWSMRCAVATSQQGRSAGAFSHKLHLLLPLYYVKYRNLVKLPLT